MKYSFILLLAMLSFAFNLPINPDMILGQWQMYRLESANGDILERNFKILEFQENGIALHIKGEFTNKSTWSYDKAKHQITVTNENKSKELVQILELTANTMIVQTKEGKVSLSKIK